MTSDDHDEALPRRSRKPVIVGVGVAAVMIGALLGYTSTRGFDGRYAVPAAGSTVPSGPAEPTPPLPLAPPLPQVHVPKVSPPPDAEAPIDQNEADEDADRIADAVTRATERALRRGDTVEWHKAGRMGYVSVSEPREYGDRVCRQVSATVVDGDAQEQSRPHLWCSDDDDEDWAPE